MSLVERVTALEQVIIQQNTHRLDRLEQSAIEADKRLTRLENLAERAENRLDRLEKAVAENTQAIKQLGQRVDHLEVKVDRLEVKVEQNTQAIEKLEVKVEQNTQAIEKLEVKVDQLDQKMTDGFKQLSNQIANLGSRWGVQNESIWRQTIATLLEKSYGVTVKRLDLGTDEIDVLVSNGDHILIEITSRFHSRDVVKVVRKRQLYTDQVQAPTRFIIAAAAIHSKVTQQLMGLGFEVIESDED